MARARNIKPAFFTNELLGTEDPMVSLTFAGLWCLADKVGILEDRPLRVKAELFPYREKLDVNGYLSVLARHGFIVRYENTGKRYIQVLNFRKHQSPHHTEKAKGMPFYTDAKSLILEGNGYATVSESLVNSEELVPERSDSLIPDLLIPDSLILKSSCNQAAPDNAKAPAVPFQKIMDAYCQALPNLPQPQAMTEKRKTALRGIWREFEKCHADDFWQRYFAYVGKSDFLVGMRGIGIDWLINKANFYKVIEGNYHA